ncbi:MAG: DUF4388 domain-containing protein [Ktedonobacterales bacterium]
MTKPKVTATDRLANVIEVVELGRRSGMLAVERGAGSVVEEGEMYFVSGRAIYAALAGLRGREALAMMARWGECRFAFDPTAPRPAPNVSGSLGGSNTGNSGALPPLSQADGVFYGGQFGSQPNMNGSNGSNGRGPVPPMPGAPYPQSVNRGGTTGSLRSGGNLPTSPNSPPASAPNMPNWGASSILPGYSPNNGSNDPSMQRRPRRAPDMRDLIAVVNAHNLSRSHRAILLLANGEHNVLDLARLSSKPLDEVVALLDELERHGLVYYY